MCHLSRRPCMDRRDFLRHAGLVSASFVLPSGARMSAAADATATAAAADAPAWRTFEVTTHVQVQQPAGRTRIWLPTPLINETPYQKPLGNSFAAEGGTVSTVNDPTYSNGIACIEFPEGVPPKVF